MSRDAAALGDVLLVGAGPGPVDLMTLRAARAVESAQALLYDALVSDEAIALAPAGCVRILTGKRSGRPSMKQEAINRLMLRLARRGLRVVRLKGGDPSVFGRVGEEAEFLRAHGVSVDVVPGVTAASAAAAQFNFPLTHRGEARRVIFTTARVGSGDVIEDWAAASDPEATVAVYMGGEAAAELGRRLIAAGRAPSTPALVVERAGDPAAALRTGRLDDLPRLLAGGTGGPVLIVIGAVARRAQDLRWTREMARIELAARRA
jgi:uroporphyrin-III C-methyltransferase